MCLVEEILLSFLLEITLASFYPKAFLFNMVPKTHFTHHPVLLIFKLKMLVLCEAGRRTESFFSLF